MAAYDIDRGPHALPTSTRQIVQRHADAVQRFTYDGPGSGGTPDATAPVVSNVTPAAGSTLSRISGTVGFDVTDPAGNLEHVLVLAYYPGLATFEVVWFEPTSGSIGAGFGPQYSGARVGITNGFRFSNVIRRGGWVSPPTFVPIAFDTAGNID